MKRADSLRIALGTSLLLLAATACNLFPQIPAGDQAPLDPRTIRLVIINESGVPAQADISFVAAGTEVRHSSRFLEISGIDASIEALPTPTDTLMVIAREAPPRANKVNDILLNRSLFVGVDFVGGDTVTITIPPAETPVGQNIPPIADAGPNQTILSGAAFSLDGRASHDPENQPLTFEWAQISGPSVSLSDNKSSNPSATAPIVAPGQSTKLSFGLVVRDPADNFGAASVNITVVGPNAVTASPTALPNPLNSGGMASLTANAAGGINPLSVTWSVTPPSGKLAGSIADIHASSTKWTSPAGQIGTWSFRVDVTDSQGNTGSGTTSIVVLFDCNTNGTDDTLEDLSDCNTNAVPDVCDIGGGLDNDCNTNGTPDRCELFNGEGGDRRPAGNIGIGFDCNTNNTLDICETDCNTNGFADICEVTIFGGNDCNSNSVPDACDPDCNTNGITDACENQSVAVDQFLAPFKTINDNATADSTHHSVIGGIVSDVIVGMSIEHTYDSDLTILLVKDGVAVTLADELGNSGDNFTNTIFDDNAPISITDSGVTAPFSGSFRPQSPLAALRGLPLSGDWTFRVIDDENNDTGTLISWFIYATGSAGDCNTNGTIDACETAADCNTNGLPDACEFTRNLVQLDQWASSVIGFSSEYSSDNWSAAQALGAPNTFDYGDISSAWTASSQDGTLEYLTLGFAVPVYANGVTIRETFGAGMVYQVDVLDTNDVLHTVWTGTDPSQPGAPVDYLVTWPTTSYLVKGVKIYVDTDLTDEWEEIDAVALHGESTSVANDCNTNGTLDLCELAAGAGDCNTNGSIDACDLVSTAETLYAVERNNPNLYTVNLTDGSLTLVGVMNNCVGKALSLSVQPATGKLYAVVQTGGGGGGGRPFGGGSNRRLAQVDRHTAVVTLGPILHRPLADIAFRADGRLYGIISNDDCRGGDVVIVNINDGSFQCTNISFGKGDGQSIAFRPGTNLLYHAFVPSFQKGSFVDLSSADADSGQITSITTYDYDGDPKAMAFNATGNQLYVFGINSNDENGVAVTDPDTGSRLNEFENDTAITGAAFVRDGSYDCNANGTPDECDLAVGPDCNTNGVIDACEADCDTNGTPDDCDLAVNGDCNFNGQLDACEFDCNTNGTPDDCDVNIHSANDCDWNGVPDECDPDCNTNGTNDRCEDLLDCNENGIPDECETNQPDCNTNGTDDECDLLFASKDCNTNGALDECDIANGALDCDNNGEPDECQRDCNTNGTADACELSGNDCDGNGVLDICEVLGSRPGRVINFDGVDDSVSTFSGFGLSSNYTISAWINLRTGGIESGNRAAVLSNSCGSGAEFLIHNDQDDPFGPQYLELGRCNFFEGQLSTAAVPLNVWTYVTVTVDTNLIVTYYINGAPAGSWDATGLDVTLTPDVFIGNDNIGQRRFDGMMDDFSLFAVARTPLEVQQQYAAGLNGTENALLLYYRFEEGAGFTARDEGQFGGANDGSLNNGPTWVSLVADCDANGTADVCEAGFIDCNTNGLLDSCETGKADCNFNSVPDECEPDCDTNGTPDACDIFFTDCNTNGTHDICEAGAADCNTNFLPDVCEPDCNTNGSADACEDFSDCNLDGTPDECQGDCNTNGTADPCEAVFGSGTDCDLDGTPDVCEPDCNTNGTADDCDITFTHSSDCDRNRVPDECDIAAGAPDCDTDGLPDKCAVDCDLNGSPDACDIALGAPDCNTNGLVDSCDTLQKVIVLSQPPTGFGAEGAEANCAICPGPTQNSSAAPFMLSQTTRLSRIKFWGFYIFGNLPDAANEFTIILHADNAGTPGATIATYPTLSAQATPTGGVVFIFDEYELNIVLPTPIDLPPGTYYLELFHHGSTGNDNFGWEAGALDPINGVPNDFIAAETPGVNWMLGNAGTLALELTSGVANDCNTNGTPDECDAGGFAVDYNTNGIPDLCEINSEPLNDCNTNGTIDVYDVFVGQSLDCNNNQTPDLCETALLDCNTNAIPDDCDIDSAGDSMDCNTDRVPDECQLGTDCNMNGVPDECELTAPPPYSLPRSPLRAILDQQFVQDSFFVNDGRVIRDVDVDVEIHHSQMSQLSITLYAPSASIPLVSGQASGPNFLGTIFDDQAAISISSGSTPYTGHFQPVSPLSVANGQSARGTWSLGITDGVIGDTGTLLSWTLILSTGTTNDCNTNGVPDECDIGMNSSLDLNNNGAIDACEMLPPP